MRNFSRARIVKIGFTYCVLNHDLFSVYAWEYTVMKFAANLNLKEHQFFLLILYRLKVEKQKINLDA